MEERKMAKPEQDEQDITTRDLDDERPGFTPSGRQREDVDTAPSTRDRDQSSALGGKVATRSKVKPGD
jgi:hypothetical protein